MTIRSWLFVPADSEKKLAKAASAGADAIILDLEDSVTLANKGAARQLACGWLRDNRQPAPARWVRINPLDTDLWGADLSGVMAGAPDGIMLPKASGPDQVLELSRALDKLEQDHGLAAGSTRILPLVSETAEAALTIPAYLGPALPRLAGFTWGAEDLSAALGASRKRDADGQWTDTFRLVRSQTLLVAHARQVMAVDTLYDNFRDTEGFAAFAKASRADGFTGMLAIHPSQVATINAAFSPSEDELAHARAIVEAFAANPEAGALQINGKMIDQPHLKLAQRLLGLKAD